MGFYMELHCDTSECPHGGNEEGVQGTNRGSIKRDARAAGWLCVDGLWYCDGCVVDHGWRAHKREPRSTFARTIAQDAGNPVDAFVTAASGIETQSAMTAGHGPKDESPPGRPKPPQ